MAEQASVEVRRGPLCPSRLKEAERSLFFEELSPEDRRELLDAVMCPVQCPGPDRIAYNTWASPAIGKVLLGLNIGKDVCSSVKTLIPRQPNGETQNPHAAESSL